MFRLGGPDPAGPAAMTSDDLAAPAIDDELATRAIVVKGSDSAVDVAPCSAVLVDLVRPSQ